MGERPDEVRGDPLGPSRRETDPLADPAIVVSVGITILLNVIIFLISLLFSSPGVNPSPGVDV